MVLDTGGAPASPSGGFKAARHKPQHNISPLWLSDTSKTLYCSTAIFNSYTSGPIHYQCTDPTSSSLECGKWPPPLVHANGCRLCCVNDGQPIDGIPFPIPTSYHPDHKKYSVAKMTCGPACAKRWVYDNYQLNGSATIHLIEHMARNLLGIRGVQMAPPTDQLEMYGGPMSLSVYRSHGTQADAPTIHSLAPHLAPHHILLEIREKALTCTRDETDLVTRVHFPPEAVSDDQSRVMWNSEVLQRPAHLPDDPVLVDDHQPTIFDVYVAAHKGEVGKGAKRKRTCNVFTADNDGAGAVPTATVTTKTTTTRKKGASAASGSSSGGGGGKRKRGPTSAAPTTPADPADEEEDEHFSKKKPRGRRPKAKAVANAKDALPDVQPPIVAAPLPRLLQSTTTTGDDTLVTVRPLKKRRVQADEDGGERQDGVGKKKKKTKKKGEGKGKKRKKDKAVKESAAVPGTVVIQSVGECADLQPAQQREAVVPLVSSIFCAALPAYIEPITSTPEVTLTAEGKEPPAKRQRRGKRKADVSEKDVGGSNS